MRFAVAREKMVREQLIAREVRDERVLAAMRKIPRHRFVDSALADRAYGDYPLPIGSGQTISQPYIVGLMTEALELKPSDTVLEIGTGSGYQAAVLAELAEKVYTVERITELEVKARRILDELGYHNVATRVFDGTYGWKDKAPFDGIIVTAAAPDILESLVAQLKVNGRMVIPVGSPVSQTLIKLVKTPMSTRTQNLTGCVFVKLIGAYGYEE
ncbi:MAG: protein-L-isoaspartate(D-aspartate) O-methyltransferase [Candidatus Tectimicrobiota bacterium]